MPKMYVIVRNDMSAGQKAVQAGHALAEWMLHDNESWKNRTLVYLTARNECHLKSIMQKLRFKQIEYTSFQEPDIGFETTAIATYGDGKQFKRLPLLD